MGRLLRVGMIGVNATASGWAFEAHVPAVQAVGGLELYAVASRSLENARRTAALTGSSRAYGDPRLLIDDPDVDIVSVVSPVPTHEQWIDAALRARKHVLTEWPVTPDGDSTARLAQEGEDAGVKTAVDLQARMSAAADAAAHAIAAGRIGRVLGTTVLATTAAFGRVIPAAAIELENHATGMNLRTIQTAHTLDFVSRVLGPIGTLQGLGAVQWPTVHVADEASERIIARSLPDRILVQGTLLGGATMSIQVIGGYPAAASPFSMEVTGTHGTLQLSGGGPRGFQASQIALTIDGVATGPRSDEHDVPESAVNVAEIYRALRDDILDDSSSAPNFGHAARLAQVIDDLERSFSTGQRIDYPAGVLG